MEGHTDSITCMTMDENILITGSDDRTIRLWNLGNFSYSGIVGEHDEGKSINYELLSIVLICLFILYSNPRLGVPAEWYPFELFL